MGLGIIPSPLRLLLQLWWSVVKPKTVLYCFVLGFVAPLCARIRVCH